LDALLNLSIVGGHASTWLLGEVYPPGYTFANHGVGLMMRAGLAGPLMIGPPLGRRRAQVAHGRAAVVAIYIYIHAIV
jgi:hypothetical protein